MRVQEFFNILKENNVNCFCGVPDSLLKDFCAYVTDNVDSKNHTITANEGYTLDGATVDCGNTATGTLTNSKLQVSGISGASTCTVTLPAKPIEPTEGTENQEA